MELIIAISALCVDTSSSGDRDEEVAGMQRDRREALAILGQI